MTITDPRLAKETTRVRRRSDYQKRPVLSATIHPDIKRTLVSMSKRTGMTVSQVVDEVLYTGLIEMHELDAPGQPPGGTLGPSPIYVKQLSAFIPSKFIFSTAYSE